MSDEDAREPDEYTRRQIIARGGVFAAAILAGASACSRPAGCGERAEREDAARRASDDTGDVGSSGDVSDASGEDAAQAEAPSTPRPEGGGPPKEYPNWQAVRDEFLAAPDIIHMAGLMLATHPKPVREAIERHRRRLDKNPVGYLTQNWGLPAERHDEEGERRVRRAAGRYLDMGRENIALTESTTTGLVTVYNGIRIREDQEVLTGHWNHWATEGTLEYRSQKAGFDIRNARLFDTLDDSVTREQLASRLIDEIAPNTRIVAVTWVHSDTGLKLPIADIGERIQEINRDRSDDDRVLFCIDGAHGFGVEDAVMDDLNCDFFVSGCHKWLFGPRGTGIIAATPQAWAQAIPTVPSFSGDTTQGRRFTPGGFHAFAHRWALAQAFDFHLNIGKDRIEQRIHALAEHLIDGLSQLDHVDLRTPTNPLLHAGIVSFAVDGMGPFEVVGQLDQDDIVASTTPGELTLARLSPGLLNTHEDVDEVIGAISRMH